MGAVQRNDAEFTRTKARAANIIREIRGDRAIQSMLLPHKSHKLVHFVSSVPSLCATTTGNALKWEARALTRK